MLRPEKHLQAMKRMSHQVLRLNPKPAEVSYMDHQYDLVPLEPVPFKFFYVI